MGGILIKEISESKNKNVKKVLLKTKNQLIEEGGEGGEEEGEGGEGILE